MGNWWWLVMGLDGRLRAYVEAMDSGAWFPIRLTERDFRLLARGRDDA